MHLTRLLSTAAAAALALAAVPFAGATPSLAGSLDATYTNYSQPASFAPSGTATYVVVARNTGTLTWPAGGLSPVHLGIHFKSASGWATDQRWALPFNVAPGQSITLSVSVHAPSSAGTYTLEEQMVQGTTGWFPDVSDRSVTVGTPSTSTAPTGSTLPVSALGASYSVSGQPSSWTPSGTATYSVTVRNAGTGTWQAGGSYPVHLGIHFKSASGWATDQRWSLPSNVAPGQSVTFQVSVQAPSTAGTYTLEEQMVEEQVAWFPQVADASATVGSSTTSGSGGSTGTSGTCTSNQTESACQQFLLGIINKDRAAAGLAPYTLNATESSGTSSCVGAYGHAVHMSQVGAISHDQFPADICVSFTTAGENVGMSLSGSVTNDIQTVDNLMMSEPHTATTCATTVNHACNILSTKYHQVGIGIYIASNGTWISEDFTN